jgi:TetR/AcrR family transcriptional regulator
MKSTFLSLDPAKRAPIVNAALKEFARKGFDDASTNEIVKEAGISKGLLFHYFNTKKELFLFLFDYCLELLKTEYLALLNTDERDIFARYRQAALLKIDLIYKHPCVFDFIGIAAFTESEQVKEELESQKKDFHTITLRKLFEDIDVSKFRHEIDIKRAINIVAWTIEGYEKQAQKELQGIPLSQVDYDAFLADFDAYIDLLKNCFYE